MPPTPPGRLEAATGGQIGSVIVVPILAPLSTGGNRLIRRTGPVILTLLIPAGGIAVMLALGWGQLELAGQRAQRGQGIGVENLRGHVVRARFQVRGDAAG